MLQKLAEHLYVPRSSHGGVKVAPPSGLCPSSTHTLRAHYNSIAKRKPFDAEMVPIQYTESLSVNAIPAHVEQSFVAYCDVVHPRRQKEELRFREVLSAVNYKSVIVCRNVESSKKNFKSVVNYWPKLKPRVYSETCYVLPKQVTETYVAFLDYHVDKERKWYTTTVQLMPKSHSNTTVHNFQMQDDPELVDSDGEEILTDSDEDRFDVSITNGGAQDQDLSDEGAEDLSANVKFVEGEPPHQESYRSHLVVNGYEAEESKPKANGDINGNLSDVEDRYLSTYNYQGRYRSRYSSDIHDNYHVPNGLHNGYLHNDEVHM